MKSDGCRLVGDVPVRLALVRWRSFKWLLEVAAVNGGRCERAAARES
jgi:hypothetical protein